MRGKGIDWDTIDLRYLYWQEKLSLDQIGERFGVIGDSVRDAMGVL